MRMALTPRKQKKSEEKRLMAELIEYQKKEPKQLKGAIA